jgi:hypothetical protein
MSTRTSTVYKHIKELHPISKEHHAVREQRVENPCYRYYLNGFCNNQHGFMLPAARLFVFLTYSSARDGNVEVPLYFLKTEQGYNVRKME